MKKTLKIKITVWFAFVLLFVSVLALFTLYVSTKTILIRDQKTHVRVSVSEFSKKLSASDSGPIVVRGIHFYDRGVYRCIFDSDGVFLQGQLPDGFKQTAVQFFEDSVREKKQGRTYYVEYDRQITLNEQDYWVKGITLLNDEMDLIHTVVQGGVLFVIILDLLSVIAVYFALRRLFAPIERIRILANEIANGRDLSRRILLGKERNELYRLANTFDGMLDKIEQTVQREKRFSSDISHELRTPLSVIRSQCEYVGSSKMSKEDYQEAIRVIQRQAERMQNLVTQLLTISRIENRGFSEAFERVNLSELVWFVCDELEEISRKDITLERSVEPNAFVIGNRDLLAVLLINLIKNAYQYSTSSGFVFVALRKEKETVVFSVRDQGVGIAQEDLAKIWDRFYRADSSRSHTENDNLGLGLSMAVQIAEYHNGKISVQSKLGEGSEFIVTIPAEQDF